MTAKALQLFFDWATQNPSMQRSLAEKITFYESQNIDINEKVAIVILSELEAKK